MNIEIPTNLSETAAAEIQAIIDREAKEQGGAFVPEMGQTYCYNTLWGCETAEWADDYRDKERFILGHCFPTADAALAADTAYRAKLDAEYAIALWLAEHKDWLATDAERANATAMKFHVIHRREEGCSVLVVNGRSFFESLGVTNFRERKYAEQFIADCGDHLRVVKGFSLSIRLVHGLPKEEGK